MAVLPLAHGIGGVQDLPVPLWLFYYGGAAVLIASFIGLGALWRRPVLERARERVFAAGTGVALARILVGTFGVFLFLVVVVSALAGTRSAFRNAAPTFVYVDFWVGVALLSALFGDVWRWLSPWRAVADAVAWTARRAGFGEGSAFVYSERLGRWPAAVLLALFVTLELAYWDPSAPRTLGVAIAWYSIMTWLGMLAFGRDAWTRNGEAFAVYFGLLSRVSPIHLRGRWLARRLPLSGLPRLDPRAGTLAMVAVMLGSTAFDGFSRTTFWQNRLFSVQSRWAFSAPRTADLVGMLLNVGGLIGVCLLVALTYTAAVRLGGVRDIGAFLGSLIPIALAYVVAHYFSLLVIQGQDTLRLVSDPLGRGWDLLGSAGFQPNRALLRPRVVWYVQVLALVVGHVLGLCVAHDRALALAGTMRRALRSQYAMLGLMVLYTVGGMWILSRP